MTTLVLGWNVGVECWGGMLFLMYVRTPLKNMCMTTIGVKLLNNSSAYIRKCQNMSTLKRYISSTVVFSIIIILECTSRE